MKWLGNFFQSVLALSPLQLAKCVYLCTNALAPAYEGIELGIGDSIIMKAVGPSPRSFALILFVLFAGAAAGGAGRAEGGRPSSVLLLFLSPLFSFPCFVSWVWGKSRTRLYVVD